MTAGRGNDHPDRQAGAGKGGKRFQIRFGFLQFLLFFLCLFAGFAWMFVFGVLVGRGLPLVESRDASLRAQLMRFMGLGREAPPPPENVAETWENPQKMVESLTYFDSLTKQLDPLSGKPRDKAPAPSEEPKQPPAKQPTEPSHPPSSAQPSAKATPPAPQDGGPQEDSQEADKAETVTERFTLLAISVRDSSNAEGFAKKLQAKGYTPRLETVDMPESGRWTRVLVGSFDSREEAVKFAAEFNRKENLQGLVVRLGR